MYPHLWLWGTIFFCCLEGRENWLLVLDNQRTILHLLFISFIRDHAERSEAQQQSHHAAWGYRSCVTCNLACDKVVISRRRFAENVKEMFRNKKSA